MRRSSDGRRARLLLALGAAAGLALAAADLLRAPRSSTTLPADAIAAINGEAIPALEYERAITALDGDRRAPLDAVDRRRVLDRLIDEELLVQRGLELGLARQDRRVRSDIVASVIESVVAEAATREPDDVEARGFYERHRDYFARPGRVRVRQMLIRVSAARADAEARARAQEAARRLQAGEEFATVTADLGDQPVVTVPDALLDPAKLREYVGPTVARVALELPVGVASKPARSSAGYHILEVLEREPASAPPFAEIADQVRAEIRRRQEDRALRDYLDELRSTSDVRTREASP